MTHTKIKVGGRLSRFSHIWKEKGLAYWGLIKNGIGWKWKKIPPTQGFTGTRQSRKENEKENSKVQTMKEIRLLLPKGYWTVADIQVRLLKCLLGDIVSWL